MLVVHVFVYVQLVIIEWLRQPWQLNAMCGCMKGKSTTCHHGYIV